MQIQHIRQLPASVIGQIAAGEVVERPAAAIKELVENSMDAGASAITVEIRDGGLTSFRVVDNGSGIAPGDIRLAFARHATSKIATAEDLYGVKTLGFRGEALASIAAVARVKCTTRMRGAEYGVSVEVEGGEMGEIKEAACPEGTAFTVKDLFFNAPVRRKFMKKPAVETGYVSDLMMRFILSHPQVSFRYLADGKTVYFSAGDGKLESAVLSVYGLQTLERLRSVRGNMNGLLLEGFVGIGDQSRGNRAHQSFILNGRLIKSGLLSSAVEEACRQRVMIGKYPMCVLHLTLPYEAADVNVHPNRWEVRFQREAEIREAVQTLVYESLRDATPLSAAASLFTDQPPETPPAVKRVSPEKYNPDYNDNITQVHNNIPDSNNLKLQSVFIPPVKAPIAPVLEARDGSFSAASVPQSGFSSNVFPPISAPVPATKPGVPVSEPKQVTLAPVEEHFAPIPVRLIGVVFDTYILLEAADRLLLCDQHAVHERLLYEQMMRDYAGDKAAQQLLVPQVIRLTHREYEIFRASQEVLLKAGFDASDYGDLTVQLRAVPMVLGSARSMDCFRDALDDLAECGQISDQRRTDRIIQMACKHAVKGGERATNEALFDLIRRMIRENVTPTCPHGRPLVIEVSQRELEKRFHRIQN